MCSLVGTHYNRVLGVLKLLGPKYLRCGERRVVIRLYGPKTISGFYVTLDPESHPKNFMSRYDHFP